MSFPSGRPHIVVVGAGLAGLAAALACADGGAAVTVVERRRRLGGLTWSFEHEGRWIDNGQHVFLRCCSAYRDFLVRIGSSGDVALQDRLDVAVLRPGRPGGPPAVARLRRNDLPAPLHMGAALLRYRHLGVTDRLRLGLAALPLRRVDLDDPALDAETFGAWLARHGQRRRSVEAMWDLICVPTVNLAAREASAAMGAKVFQTGMLTDKGAADIGWSRIPLGRLHGERAAAALGRAGATVVVGERVASIKEGKAPARSLEVRTEGRDLDADAVVVAVPHHAINDVLAPESFAGQGELAGLGSSPIVDVHVVYDRHVTDLPMAAAIDSPVQWVFDRTVSSGLEPRPGPERDTGGRRRQYLAVSLSAADAQLGRRPEDLGLEVVAALAELLPGARDARVLDTLVTKERNATFRAVPGTAVLRPGSLTHTPGVVLAGAWTDTGWPATMEGAVRSGQRAARAALMATGSTRRLPEEVA